MTVTVKDWLAGARPRTLPAAIVPVLIGTAVAAHAHPVNWWHALGALFVALALQVATNYANDYSDGIRGTDNARVGPVRLVASGIAPAKSVRNAAFIAFAVAAVVGTVLSLAVNPLLIVVVGVPAVLAGWFYTGGKRPYGYAGFGEVFVFVFFGLAATLGSEYVQTESVSAMGAVAATCAGLLAVALLLVNNLRDIPGDTVAHKRTLAVRIGDRATRSLYSFCIGVPFVLVVASLWWRPWLALALIALSFAVSPVRAVLRGDRGRDLVAVLIATSRLQLAFAALFALGVWL